MNDEVAAACLATLPDASPSTTKRRLEFGGSPARAFKAAVQDLELDPALFAARVRARRTRAFWKGGPDYPFSEALPDLPSILLAEGERPDALSSRTVAIVGTRSATPHGIADAEEIAGVVALAGVTVISGLAIGIDAAAHQGALDVGGLTVGVVATGLDVTYPRRHTALYSRVRASGLLVGEQPYGVQPEAFRFPVRNRIIAALADVVVVVEATLKGGARITAEKAIDYGRPVLAVPGSRRNAAAAGTNALIADGAHPLLDPSDVLVTLGIASEGQSSRSRPDAEHPNGIQILAAFSGEPATVDQLVSRTTLSVAEISAALRLLERTGHVEASRGYWWPM